jgi:hypothetical protein
MSHYSLLFGPGTDCPVIRGFPTYSNWRRGKPTPASVATGLPRQGGGHESAETADRVGRHGRRILRSRARPLTAVLLRRRCDAAGE